MADLGRSWREGEWDTCALHLVVEPVPCARVVRQMSSKQLQVTSYRLQHLVRLDRVF